MAPPGARRDAGLSLLETVMALALTLLVLGAIFELASPAGSFSRFLPETANVQQRLRHAFDRLHTDLLDAGRGTVLVSPGPLGRLLPPVVPYRLGRRADRVEHRRARPGSITTLSVSRDVGSEATSLSPIVGPAPVVRLDPGPGCAPPVCGYRVRDLVLVFDERRAWELFRVTGTGALTLTLERAHATTTVFAPGAVIAKVELDHYYADEARSQLRHYDGWQGDFPVIDDLVDLRFRFFGDAPTDGPACQESAPHSAGDPIGEIDLAQLTDGPWCGPAGLPFDADLIRIRAVGVGLRVQSAVAELRGADPRLFARPGSVPGGRGVVPDHAVSFTVAPRNLVRWRSSDLNRPVSGAGAWATHRQQALPNSPATRGLDISTGRR